MKIIAHLHTQMDGRSAIIISENNTNRPWPGQNYGWRRAAALEKNYADLQKRPNIIWFVDAEFKNIHKKLSTMMFFHKTRMQLLK